MSLATERYSTRRIVYPESDGEPMAENTLQFQWIVTIVGGLRVIFRDRDDVFVAGDLFWYPIEGDPKTRIAPDALVAFGRPPGHRRSYLQWEEGGIAPQVVFEVLSPSNTPAQMLAKFQFYDRFGVEEYYIYDPDNVTTEGWMRTGEGLQSIVDMNNWSSPWLGVRFELGEKSLTLYGPDNRPFSSYEELAEDRDELTLQRDELTLQRDELARQCEAERDRAERLAAELRKLGIEPEAS